MINLIKTIRHNSREQCMSRALAVFHGHFGRATVYQLNRPFNVHAHREGHLIFHIGGAPGCVEVPRAAEPAARRYRRRGQSLGAAQFPAERFGRRSALPCPLRQRRVVRRRSWFAFWMHDVQAHRDTGPECPAGGGDDLRRSLAQGSRRRAAQPDRTLVTKRAGARRMPRRMVVPAPRSPTFACASRSSCWRKAWAPRSSSMQSRGRVPVCQPAQRRLQGVHERITGPGSADV